MTPAQLSRLPGVRLRLRRNMHNLEQIELPRNFLDPDGRQGRALAFYYLNGAAHFRVWSTEPRGAEWRAACILRARYFLNLASYFGETRFLRQRLP